MDLMRSKRARRLSFLAMVATAVIAVTDGLSQLSCAPTPTVLVIVAGSFTAGASLAAFVAESVKSRVLPRA
jgi:hypothetical protein